MRRRKEQVEWENGKCSGRFNLISIIEAERDIWFCVDKYGVWAILPVCFSILKRYSYSTEATTDEIGRCAGILHISVHVLYFASTAS